MPRKKKSQLQAPAAVADLRPCPVNPRSITPEALEALGSSVAEFGDISGIVWNRRTGHLVAGHQRIEALKMQFGDKLIITDRELRTPAGELFGIRVVDWPKGKATAAMIAANSECLTGDWSEGLNALLGELPDSIGDLFQDLHLDQLLEMFPVGEEPRPGLTDPDDVPEPPDDAITKPGDLNILGKHRLLCGDSASADDVDRLLDGAAIHLVNTDPPYNVKVEPRSSTAIAAGMSSYPDLSKKMHHQKFDVARGVGDPKKAKRKMRAKDRPLVGDFVTDEEFVEMLRAWFGQMARVLKPGGAFYVWGGYANLGNYPPRLKDAGMYFSQGVIWDKQHPVLTRKDFMGAFEICFYGWREGAGHKFYGPPNATDLWHIKKVAPQKMVHLTEKPVELAVRAMQYSSKAGDNVLDLFGGSGSTLIAAEQMGRRAFLMEIDPLYCDVIVERYENFTGQKAKRLNAKKTRKTKG